MTKYIDHFPKPFLDDLVQGRCIPFIGAGFSKNAKIPRGKQMPLWDDLGKSLAATIPEYEYTSAIDALSAYEYEFSRPKLIETLHELLLVDSVQPGNAHKAFCDLPFDLCVTTNFEFLVEKGYEASNRYCRPIIDEDQLSIDAKGSEVKLLKFHGDLHHPNRMIATENDYDTFLDRYPLLATYLGNLLIVRTALFIGYSLEDPDFRHIWQLIGDRLGKLRRQAYTILVSAAAPAIARFERRGVKVINLPGKASDYPQILSEVFAELKDYWSDKIIETSTTTEEESLAEFSLPKRKANRLCFFSVPSRLSAYYKSFIYPIAEKHGFVPIMAVDMISPGDNIAAKVSALIDRSEIIVVDTSSPNTETELHLALSRKRKKVLILKEEGRRLPSDIEGLLYIIRPKGDDSENAEFLYRLDQWFTQQAIEVSEVLSDEPLRLIRKREYRAAVISATTLFESFLRGRLDTDRPLKVSHFSMWKMIDYAFERQLIAEEDIPFIKELVDIRNRAVHMAEEVPAKQAKLLVEKVMDIVDRMQ